MTEESRNRDPVPANPDFETTGSEELDNRLAEPVLKGQVGLDKAMVWAGAFLIVVVGLAAYASVFGVPFHAPEQTLIVENDALHRVARFPESTVREAPGSVALFTLALNWQFGAGSAAAFRAFSLLLHLANGVLVYLLCRRLLRRRVPEAVAMLAGMLFVLHPANVEAVASTTGRGELLATLFSLASLLLYAHATRVPGRLDLPSLALGLAAYACAFGAHFGAWCVVLLAALIDPVINEAANRACRLAALGCYAGLLAILTVAYAVAQPEVQPLHNPAGRAVDPGALADAFVRGVWPFGLSVAPASWDSGVVSGFVLGVVAIIACLGGIAASRWRVVGGVAAAWFAVALASVALASGGGAVADPALYLPLAGFVVLVPWGFDMLPERQNIRTGAGLVCALLLLLLGVGTYARTTLWHSEVALWRDAVRKTPHPAFPKERLGDAHIRAAVSMLAEEAELREAGYASAARELRTEALEQFAQGRGILSALPTEALSAQSLFRLGLAHKHLDEPEAALESFVASLERDISCQACVLEAADLIRALANREDDRQELLRALDFYEYARSLGELPPRVAATYGDVLANMGRYEEAVQALTLAVRESEGGAAEFGRELEAVRTALQQVAAVEGRAHELAGEDPHSQQARMLSAQSLLVRNRLLQASYTLEGILDEGDAPPDAWVLLGYARTQMGQAESFLGEWPSPPESNAQQAPLWMRLAQMCAARGSWDAAEQFLLTPQAGMAGIRTPLMTLGALSIQLQQPGRAHAYFQRAAEANPDAYAPWLALSDLAMAQGNASGAQQLLAEAEERGAPAGELEQRRARAGGALPAPPTQPGEVIIR